MSDTLSWYRSLPTSPGSFYYGSQFQDEAAEIRHKQDLEFWAWASAELKAGNRVFYSCC